MNFRGPDRLLYHYLDRVKRIWYLSPMRAAKVQASLRIRAVSPEPPLLAHISSESRGTFRQKARSMAPLNGWACAVKICHDGMREDTNSLDGAQFYFIYTIISCHPFQRDNYYSCSLRSNYMRNTFVLFLLELQVNLKLNYHVYLFHLNENKKKKTKKKNLNIYYYLNIHGKWLYYFSLPCTTYKNSLHCDKIPDLCCFQITF